MLAKALDLVLVDDDEFIQELVERRLRDACVRLIAFSNGLLALEYLRHTKPDILLIDQYMPRLCGLDLLRELNGFLPDQVYLCSGGCLPPNLQLEANGIGVRILPKETLVKKDGLTSLFGLLPS